MLDLLAAKFGTELAKYFLGFRFRESKMKLRLAILTAALFLVGGVSVASANMITVGDGATGTGPYTLVSNSSVPDSYVDVTLSTPIQFDDITNVSADFVDNLGGSYGGSPRIVLFSSGTDFFPVYLGGPPSFIDSNAATLTTDFSGANMDNGTNDSAFENSGSYQTLASLQGTYGSDEITDIAFVVDGGWAVNQNVTLDGLSLNGTNIAANVPEPSPLPMLLAGLGLVGGAFYFGRKKSKATA